MRKQSVSKESIICHARGLEISEKSRAREMHSSFCATHSHHDQENPNLQFNILLFYYNAISFKILQSPKPGFTPQISDDVILFDIDDPSSF